VAFFNLLAILALPMVPHGITSWKNSMYTCIIYFLIVGHIFPYSC
jgi:hypothetical protein